MRDKIFLWGQRQIEQGAWFFAPLSFFFAFAVFLKNMAYDRKWVKQTRLRCPVVSVGNIVAGGTGKTPLIHLLGQRFSSRKIAILSRGYGKDLDEPLLLQRRLPFARVYVGKNRVLLAKKAEKEGAELILIDDGFQYRSLYRDLDLVMLKGSDPLGKNHYLPWGFLRDNPKRLKEAACVIASGRFVSRADVQVEMRVDRIIGMEGEEIGPLKGSRVAIFSGIANPDLFKKTVESLGADVVSEWVLADHVKPEEKALKCFVEKAKKLSAQLIVCTEKDAVKLLGKDLRLSLPICYLEVSFHVVQGEMQWENLIAKIEQKIDTSV
jgi:tetraacyldisaccharide 4'-kinase